MGSSCSMHQRRHHYDQSLRDRQLRPRFSKNIRYSKRAVNRLEDSSSMHQTGRHDTEKGIRSSLLHSVISPIPDESIEALYQDDSNFAIRSSYYGPPKSLAELACHALCRSLPNMETEIPPGIPQDVVNMILNSLKEHSALTATTLRSLRNCEMSELSFTNCRGVTDEWLEPLAPRRLEDVRGKFLSFSTSDFPVGQRIATNQNAVFEEALHKDSRELNEVTDNPICLNPIDNFDLKNRSRNSESSASSFFSVDENQGMTIPDESNDEFITNPRKHYYQKIDDFAEGFNINESSIESFSAYKMSKDENRSPSLDETEVSYESTNSKGSDLRCSDLIIQEQNYLPSSSENDASIPYQTFAATSGITFLDLRGCQHITDQGLMNLGFLFDVEVALFDNCHSLTGTGLRVLVDSKKLHTLSLAYCRRLTDDGIVCISQCLPALKTLSLEGCRCLSDRSLLSISGLVSLRELDLCQCDLITDVGFKYLENLRNLSTISLGWCRNVTDKGIDTLTMQPGRATTIRVIRLARLTGITDVGITYIGRLSSLERLDLSGCCSVTSVALGSTLEKLTKLETLDVSYCPGILLSNWQGKIRSLKTLELCYSGVKDGQLTQFLNLPALQQLNLDSCPVGDIAISYLADNQVLPNLLSLDLADTNLTDLGMSKIAKFTNLTRLSLFYCNITNESLLHVSKLSDLEVLNIDSRDVSDDGLRHLRSLTKLRALDIFSGRITDSGCSHLSNITSLESLELCGGGISDLGCSFLASLEKLTHLNLSQNERITNRGAAALAILANLKSLNLSHTRVNASGLRFFSGLRNLQSLALFGCKGVNEDKVIRNLQNSLPKLKCIRKGNASGFEGMIVVSDDNESCDEEEFDLDDGGILCVRQSNHNSDSDDDNISEYLGQDYRFPN